MNIIIHINKDPSKSHICSSTYNFKIYGFILQCHHNIPSVLLKDYTFKSEEFHFACNVMYNYIIGNPLVANYGTAQLKVDTQNTQM